METLENRKVVKIEKSQSCILVEDNTIHKVEFTVGSSPDKKRTVMDLSWEGYHMGGTITKRYWLDLQPEQTRILWMKRDYKTLQRILKKSEGNYEYIDFKHCMKMYEKGGDKNSKNWTVRFLSEHDFEIINLIEQGNERKFMDECGGSYHSEGHKLLYTKKEKPEEFNDLWI